MYILRHNLHIFFVFFCRSNGGTTDTHGSLWVWEPWQPWSSWRTTSGRWSPLNCPSLPGGHTTTAPLPASPPTRRWRHLSRGGISAGTITCLTISQALTSSLSRWVIITCSLHQRASNEQPNSVRSQAGLCLSHVSRFVLWFVQLVDPTKNLITCR